MNDRLKNVRKTLHLTQKEFAAKLGITDSGISRLEKGQNKLTDQMIRTICHEYRVSYDYLKFGIGEMFLQTPIAIIDDLCKQYDLDDFDRVMIQEYLLMDDTSREVLKNYLRKFAERIYMDKTKSEIDEKVASYRAELEAQAASGKLSQSQIGDVEGA